MRPMPPTFDVWLKAGEALDREQVPTIVLAHWPNRVCEYYRLLLRITARTPAIGKWILSNEYFENTDLSYHQERFTSNQFQQSWFTGAIALTPAQLVERVRDYHQLHARVVSLQNLANLVYQLDNYHRTAPQAITAEAEETATPEYAALPVASWAPPLRTP